METLTWADAMRPGDLIFNPRVKPENITPAIDAYLLRLGKDPTPQAVEEIKRMFPKRDIIVADDVQNNHSAPWKL